MGGTNWQGSTSFTALSPGTYDIRIMDAVNTACVITLDALYEITQPDILDASVASSDVTCNGSSDGTISNK